MGDTAVIPKPPKGFWPYIWKTGSMLVAAALTWFAGFLYKEYQAWTTTQEDLAKRLERLEEDKAKWATLAALEEKVIQQRVELEILRQVFSYEYARKVPTGFPDRPGQPTLVPPEELFKDIEKYKAMQQQRYPVQKK